MSAKAVVVLLLVSSVAALSSSSIDTFDDDVQLKALAALDSRMQAPTPDPSLIVQTSEGAVEGFVDSQSHAQAWLGIPFAMPPVGTLRFKPPQMPANRSNVYQATAFKPACMQAMNFIYAPFSEDCLYLNIYAPPNHSLGDALPVMVFVHGGSFNSGGANMFLYWGYQMVNQSQVIVVTINYRLGAFGWLVNDALKAEDPAFPTSGNLGLWDQWMALQWVQRNIAGFGGDPQAVTVFGESAGAISLCTHLIMPVSAGLFRSVILESGPCVQGGNSPAKAGHKYQDFLPIGNAFVAYLGCNNSDPVLEVACLRSLNASTIIQAQVSTGIGWSIVVDNVTVPLDPLTAWETGATHNVSILLGTNVNEGTMFVDQHLTDDTYKGFLQGYFGDYASLVYNSYPTSQYASPSAAAAAVFGDFFFLCPSRRLLQLQPATTLNYQYLYAHFLSWITCPGYFCNDTTLGVKHSDELWMVFGAAPPFFQLTPVETYLSGEMIAYWTNFAIHGKPFGTSPSSTVWPAYDPVGQSYIILNDTITTSQSYASARCNFWDSITS